MDLPPGLGRVPQSAAPELQEEGITKALLNGLLESFPASGPVRYLQWYSYRVGRGTLVKTRDRKDRTSFPECRSQLS